MFVNKTATAWPHASMPTTAAPRITRDPNASRSHGLEIPQGDLEDLSAARRPVYVLSGLGWRYG